MRWAKGMPCTVCDGASGFAGPWRDNVDERGRWGRTTRRVEDPNRVSRIADLSAGGSFGGRPAWGA